MSADHVPLGAPLLMGTVARWYPFVGVPLIRVMVRQPTGVYDVRVA
jgi:hypothetical protein